MLRPDKRDYSDLDVVVKGRISVTGTNSASGKNKKLIYKNNAPLILNPSINDNIKFLEKIKQGYKRTVSWNKHRSKVITKPKDSNLDYMIDPTFRIIDRLFVLSFKIGDNNSIRDFHKKFLKYYMS